MGRLLVSESVNSGVGVNDSAGVADAAGIAGSCDSDRATESAAGSKLLLPVGELAICRLVLLVIRAAVANGVWFGAANVPVFAASDGVAAGGSLARRKKMLS